MGRYISFLFIVLSVFALCNGCSGNSTVLTNTEYVVLVPDIIPSPPPPSLVPYRTNEELTSYHNFRAFQVNQFELVDHITLLRRNLNYYELQIIQLQERQKELGQSTE